MHRGASLRCSIDFFSRLNGRRIIRFRSTKSPAPRPAFDVAVSAMDGPHNEKRESVASSYSPVSLVACAAATCALALAYRVLAQL